MSTDFYAALGVRLRAARLAKRLTLDDVEAQSAERWKAETIGAYERAERRPSIESVVALAALYETPVSQFLPMEERTGERMVRLDALIDHLLALEMKA